MRTGLWRMVMVGIAAGGLALTGCGDSNLFGGASESSGDGSQMEEGLAALDAGDYEKAIEIFSALDQNDPNVKNYLASAYLGLTGFDTLLLVDLIAEAEDNGGEDPNTIYDSITKVFDPDGDGIVSSADLVAQKANIDSALAILGDGDGDRDLEVQAGTYAAIHSIVLIAEVLNMDDVSEEAVSGLSDTQIDTQITAGYVQEIQEDLERNLTLIDQAIDALVGTGSAEDNDLAGDFSEFLVDVGFSDQSVDSNDLSTYLKTNF